MVLRGDGRSNETLIATRYLNSTCSTIAGTLRVILPWMHPTELVACCGLRPAPAKVVVDRSFGCLDSTRLSAEVSRSACHLAGNS